LIASYIKDGKIVPVKITVNLLKNAMQESMAVGKFSFLIDGFPRNEDNNAGWEEVMGDFAEVKFVMFFDCPEEVMEKRLLKRGETSGRIDDNIESIKKRFRTFLEDTLPIIQKYEKLGKVHKMDATKTPEEVYASVKVLFQ